MVFVVGYFYFLLLESRVGALLSLLVTLGYGRIQKEISLGGGGDRCSGFK